MSDRETSNKITDWLLILLIFILLCLIGGFAPHTDEDTMKRGLWGISPNIYYKNFFGRSLTDFASLDGNNTVNNYNIVP